MTQLIGKNSLAEAAQEVGRAPGHPAGPVPAHDVAAADPTTQAYAELQRAFDHYNRELFEGVLPYCLITMQREKRTYGYFCSRRFLHRSDKKMTDEIAINPSYFGIVPFLEIMQTLVHEMVHAWQFHFGHPGRRGYHNQEWASKMEAIGLMPSDTGRPGGAKTGEKMADYTIVDGRFDLATKMLLKQNFQISWVDRFPPVDVMTPQSEGNARPSAAGMGDSSLPAAGQVLPSSGLPLPEPSVLTALAPFLEPPKTPNRSNRCKYRCPACGDHAWGKPGLKLLCGREHCEAAPFTLAG